MSNVFPRLLSQDKVLMQLLETCKEQIVSVHEHESLLDHKEEEELSEAERKAAWAEYEAEVMLLRVERDLVVEVTRASVLYFYINVFFSLSVKHSQQSSQLKPEYFGYKDQ